MVDVPEKKKRGRRRKEDIIDVPLNNITIIIDENGNDNVVQAKKRGRKPKGGKLIIKQTEEVEKINIVKNIILHLKCSLYDLEDYNNNLNKIITNPSLYNPDMPPNIQAYNSDKKDTFSIYDEITEQPDDNFNLAYGNLNKINDNNIHNNICNLCKLNIDDEPKEASDNDINIKDINYKLKQLKINLYKNNLQDKKSACFWCTYEYDNPSCYIPKYEIDETIFGYGSFCRPECAVAYLMKENLDDSTKFERYHLLNQIYGKVYQHKKNIKPAPNPYFLLDKFYGNLSIQEYRKLLKTEHMLLVVDKPMTRILPELYEDNDEFVLSIYGRDQNVQCNNSSMYKVKRQSDKQSGPSKNSIMKDKFGLSN